MAYFNDDGPERPEPTLEELAAKHGHYDYNIKCPICEVDVTYEFPKTIPALSVLNRIKLECKNCKANIGKYTEYVKKLNLIYENSRKKDNG